jgi:hypothetical protein
MIDPTPRRRTVPFGEMIAFAALIVSALGLWLTWKNMQKDGPTRIVEQKQAIPLVLRGAVQDDGKALAIAPVETSHALQSLTLTVPSSGTTIEIGSDGILSARAVESASNLVHKDKGPYALPVEIKANYVEAGTDKAATGKYRVRYRLENGGLFSGRSLKLTGFSRG